MRLKSSVNFEINDDFFSFICAAKGFFYIKEGVLLFVRSFKNHFTQAGSGITFSH